MADPVPQNSWLVFLDWLKKLIEENWSGLAMILWGYEEKKVDAAKQEQETAALKEAEAENENKILKEYSGKSDADIVNEFSNEPDDKS